MPEPQPQPQPEPERPIYGHPEIPGPHHPTCCCTGCKPREGRS